MARLPAGRQRVVAEALAAFADAAGEIPDSQWPQHPPDGPVTASRPRPRGAPAGPTRRVPAGAQGRS